MVPVIAKADTLTKSEQNRLKKRIMEQLETHKIRIYNLPEAEEDEEEGFVDQLTKLKKSVPFTVMGSMKYFPKTEKPHFISENSHFEIIFLLIHLK